MRRSVLTSCLALAVCGVLAWSAPALAEGRTAEQILKDIDAVKMPDLPEPARRSDQKVVKKFLDDRQKAESRRAELIGELYRTAPDRDELTRLLPERWSALLDDDPEKIKAVKAEIGDVASKTRSNALKVETAFWRAVIASALEHDGEAAVKATEEFLKLAPKNDDRGPMLLYSAAGEADDVETQGRLLRRLIHDFPDSDPAKMAESDLKRVARVGKPFELEFTDAITGTDVSMKTLKGKVVVVDFWATWCGPCVAEMPKMKKLYAQYKDKGVEFVGVSLDEPKAEGGLDKLKAFVAKNAIPWPQYYQGKGWESEFSKSWDIVSIPAVFVVDAQGNLHSVYARGKLETLIPRLLKKAGGRADAGAIGN